MKYLAVTFCLQPPRKLCTLESRTKTFDAKPTQDTKLQSYGHSKHMDLGLELPGILKAEENPGLNSDQLIIKI